MPESLRRSYAHYVYHTGVYLCGLFAECTRPPREDTLKITTDLHMHSTNSFDGKNTMRGDVPC